MDIKTLIPAEDVLTSEMESIYGGSEPFENNVCNGNGIINNIVKDSVTL